MGIREKLGKEILFFDGAMGTMLQKKGLKLGKMPEDLNIDNPEIIEEIHRLYVKSGADIITICMNDVNKIHIEHIFERSPNFKNLLKNKASFAMSLKYLAMGSLKLSSSVNRGPRPTIDLPICFIKKSFVNP